MRIENNAHIEKTVPNELTATTCPTSPFSDPWNSIILKIAGKDQSHSLNSNDAKRSIQIFR